MLTKPGYYIRLIDDTRIHRCKWAIGPMKTIEEAEDHKKELGIVDPIFLLTQEKIEKAKMLLFKRKCEKASRLIKGDHRLLWWESRMC